MVATEIVVALISTVGSVLVGPIVGLIIKKKCEAKKKNDEEKEEVPPSFCQIQQTELLKLAGLPIYNNKQCSEQKTKCRYCGLWFCPFHLPVNNNGDLNGGHVCKPITNP